MTEKDRAVHIEATEGRVQQLGLRRRRPAPLMRPARAAVARPGEGDDAGMRRGAREQSREHEVVDHRAESVHQDQRRPAAALEVMEPDAIDVKETATHPMRAFRSAGADLYERRSAERGNR